MQFSEKLRPIGNNLDGGWQLYTPVLFTFINLRD